MCRCWKIRKLKCAFSYQNLKRKWQRSLSVCVQVALATGIINSAHEHRVCSIGMMSTWCIIPTWNQDITWPYWQQAVYLLRSIIRPWWFRVHVAWIACIIHGLIQSHVAFSLPKACIYRSSLLICYKSRIHILFFISPDIQAASRTSYINWLRINPINLKLISLFLIRLINLWKRINFTRILTKTRICHKVGLWDQPPLSIRQSLHIASRGSMLTVINITAY